MSFTISNAKDITTDKSTYLIYGKPGSGKTHTLNFLPGRTLYVNVDKSERPLKGNENIDILNFNSHEAWQEWGDLMKWFAENKQTLNNYDTIVIDNLSELFRSMLANLGRAGKNNRVPEMSHYQRVDFFTIDSLRFLQSLGKRLVFLAWETNYDFYTPAGQQITQSVPDIRKTIRDNVAGLCQVVARLIVNKESGKRGFILMPTNNVFAKNQLDDREHCLQDELFKVGDVGG
ncbi:AAA family ATPase [Staphylococcus pseudintermedius]|uniref:AAA family ATPase n=1 Tax=Staphylococcus pseudintermedius TaxID=283734 RepID=UPI001020FFFB|nr:AAA family ATPase [Staphylococcus pseudintermedius]MBM0369114.1 DNA-binding protein [Staphylococcus pseudintermedius]MDT0907164.1 AAA family ATPase [Staphylococcus pseudintermedius]MDT0936257.1 AAA family ATPase [Staphylococcus pseudintermedius]RYR81567.1 DNA-binding protein [Staphylococcus pseudintermedius]RYR89881.1 DNA-binding protein [Staphylococcus pseudintermedius]